MWVGGRSYRSLRRAVELGRRLGAVRHADRRDRSASGPRPRDRRLGELAPSRSRSSCRTSARSTRGAEPDRVAEQVQRLVDAGATALNVRFVHHSAAHYKEQLAALRTIV